MKPELLTEIPGPLSRELAVRLREYESHNVTYVSEAWPVFWDRAEGVNVWDVDGNRFLDMTSAFGVAGLGHTNAATVQAMRDQSERLIHGMGDVHPTQLKVDLCAKLSEMTFERWGAGRGKVTLANSGFETVEIALKTALIATGKKGVICFQDGYHGLGYGALLGSSYDKFRDPFSSQLLDLRKVLSFPRDLQSLEGLKDALGEIDASEFGALLVEPIQGRGGKIVPPVGFLVLLREWCDANRVVLIFDEIYSGFNRTGKLFACEWENVVPDLICVGKAMSGGFPISACIGKSEIMDTWPVSSGEALHTSTYLGNPVGCAMSLAALSEHEKEALRDDVNRVGDYLVKSLRALNLPMVKEVRGRGLMIGVELQHSDGSPMNAGFLLEALLAKGVMILADGPDGNVLAFTPPFEVSEEDLDEVISVLSNALCRK